LTGGEAVKGWERAEKYAGLIAEFLMESEPDNLITYQLIRDAEVRAGEAKRRAIERLEAKPADPGDAAERG
jgi:hypothetical protein